MSNVIQDAMRAKGMTAAALSKASGVPYGTVYDIARGKTEIDKMEVGKFLRIARALGMSADELYTSIPDRRTYADPRQESLNANFEKFTDEGRDELARIAERMSHDETILVEYSVVELDR